MMAGLPKTAGLRKSGQRYASVILIAVFGGALMAIGSLIWLGSLTADFRYLSCMGCHM